MLLAVLLPAGEAEADAAEVMRCSTGRHLCGATRPVVNRGTFRPRYNKKWVPCPRQPHRSLGINSCSSFCIASTVAALMLAFIARPIAK